MNVKSFAPRVRSSGYVFVAVPDHPRADTTGRVREHILVVERALGKFLRPDAAVHHVDRNRANNANTNLVACDSQAYHLLLHRRLRAFEATGDPNAVPCRICGSFERQSEMYRFKLKSAGEILEVHEHGFPYSVANASGKRWQAVDCELTPLAEDAT